MEHHSNQTSWIETIAEVVLIPHTKDGNVDLDGFKVLLNEYEGRELKIAAVTSCSNVTGVFTPYSQIAEIMHKNNGLCFVDFACSAPYIDINMHPKNKLQQLDAIYFSPHKFLGGPGSTGILVFNKDLYTNKVPDTPGGGTVDWTNPWGEHKFVDDIESRYGDTIEIHPHFLYADGDVHKLEHYSKDFYKEFKRFEEYPEYLVFEKADGTKTKYNDYSVFKNTFTSFKGWDCWNNNYEISYDGYVHRVCFDDRVNLIKDIQYFKNIKRICPVTCPHMSCNCDGLLKIHKESVV